MTSRNKIEGVIRLISPLHCASGDKSTDEKYPNLTRTHKTFVMTANGNQSIPYFPGNDGRGRLRRKAATIVLEHIAVTQKVGVDLYAGLMAGAIAAAPESDVTIEEVLRARDNPYMGLFGGATRMLRSRFAVNDMIPVLQDTMDAGIVPRGVMGEGWRPMTNTSGKPQDLTGYYAVESRTSLRVNDVMLALNPTEMERYIEDAANAVTAKQSLTIAQRIERKEDKAAAKAAVEAGEKAGEIASKKDVGNMYSIEAIVRGTPLYWLIDLANDVTDEHVGLLLLSLQALVREQALGGMIRNGFGRYSANLTLTRAEQKFTIFQEGKDSADATLTDEVHQAFCVPALAALQKLTAEDMMEFFTPRVKLKTEKVGKGRKTVDEVAA